MTTSQHGYHCQTLLHPLLFRAVFKVSISFNYFFRFFQLPIFYVGSTPRPYPLNGLPPLPTFSLLRLLMLTPYPGLL